MPDVLDLNNLSPKQKAALMRAFAKLAQQELAGAPAEADLTSVPVFMVSHNRDHVLRVKGDKLVDAQGNEHGPDKHNGFTTSPIDGAPLGHGPVAYNGKPIESYEDHLALQKGDSAALAKYAKTTDEGEEA